MGDRQICGPFLGPYYNTGPNTGPNLGHPKRDHNFDNPPNEEAHQRRVLREGGFRAERFGADAAHAQPGQRLAESKGYWLL